MEAGDRPRVYDADLDGKPEEDNENQQQTAAAEGQAGKTDGQKKPRKPLLKLDPAFLIDGPRGLKRLYKHVVMDAEKNF
jgi:hypothetical protein